ncbi:MAG: alpha/beta fold hydrolase [Alphaproteobacteria bacterium]|nr:alpha/beta fold hydrolase [Alphaproteobacteria bacterium]
MTLAAERLLPRETISGIGVVRRPGSGSLPPLVLLHGIGSNAESWAPTLARLDPRIEALAWDAPGYRGSEPLPVFAPHPRDYAERLAILLDALGLERVALAGHSLGALFAGSFAVLYPERVLALALLSPASGYGVTPGEPLPTSLQARIDDLERLGPEAFAAARSARLVFRPEAKPEALAGVRRAMAAVRLSGYAQAVRALGAGDLLADAARIAAPTLAAIGAEDVVTPPAGARAAYATLGRGLRFVEVADAGHALPQELPETVAGLLRDLVEAAVRPR